MITNQDNYLFLKQMLVAIQACRNGVEIDVSGIPVDKDKAIQAALGILQSIEDNFTIPYFVSHNTVTTIDFEHLTELVELMLPVLEDVDDREALILEVTEPDNLLKAIVDYPNLNIWLDEHRNNLRDTIRFKINHEIIAEGANSVDKTLMVIRNWLESEQSTRPLTQLIILINSIQLIDELYQFCNDRFIGC